MNRWGIRVVIALSIFGISYALRAISLERAYDVFIDEVTYIDLADSIRAGHGVLLFGQPFFLHPPGFFAIEAAFLTLVGSTGDTFQRVADARHLDALVGAGSAVAVWYIAQSIGGTRVALASATIFALDPFILRTNSRNLIETTAVAWVLAGHAVLLPRLARRLPLTIWHCVAAGLFFGAAVLSKDMTAFLTVGPLLIFALLDGPIDRRRAILIAGIVAACYAAYLTSVVLVGQWDLFQYQKLRGLMRFVGVLRETGFQAGGPSFAAAIATNLAQFLPTYVLLAAGTLSVPMLWRAGGARRALSVWTAFAYGVVAYSALFGTNEEQFFYLVVVPVTIAVPLLMSRPLRLGRRREIRLSPERYAPALLTFFLLWSATIWAEFNLGPDDGYHRMSTYLHQHAEPGARLGVVASPERSGALLVFRLFRLYDVEPIGALEDICTSHPRYVVVSLKQVTAGYVPNGPEVVDWLHDRGTVAFAFTGRFYGALELYDVRNACA